MVSERGNRIDKGINKIAVVFAEPQEDNIDHLISVLIKYPRAARGFNCFSQIVVAIGVVANFLYRLAM